MRKTILAALMVMAGTVSAQAEATEDQKAALIAAIEADGCMVTGENADAILATAGVDGETAEEIINELGEAGMAEKGEAGLKLKTANCP